VQPLPIFKNLRLCYSVELVYPKHNDRTQVI